MSQLVVFPDAVLVVVSVLRDELASLVPSATVGSRVPANRAQDGSDTFVVVYRDGGTRRNVVTDEPQIGLDCWAPTEAAAHDLAQYCRAIVHRAVGTTIEGVFVSRVDEFGGPQNFPDPDSDQPRYVLSFVAAMRGTAI